MLLFCAVAVAVVCALLLAPRKPPAPPASAIAFEAKPQKAEPAESDDSPAPSRPARGKPKPTETAPAENQPEARYLIRGTVTEAKTGKPIAKALVICAKGGRKEKDAPQQQRPRRRGPFAPARFPDEDQQLADAPRTYTDKDGHYALRVAEPGEYAFFVRSQGFVSVRDKRGMLAEDPGELVMDFTLARGASISGRVTESGSSKGAPGIRVRAEGTQFSTVPTGDDGRYTVMGLTPGDYAITLDLSKAAYVASGMAPSRNVSVKTETQEVTGVDFSVEVAGEVWGYVLTREGDPLSSTDVIVCSSASVFSQLAEASIKKAPPLSNRSDEQGYFNIVGVPLNKEWRLYAIAKERAPQLSAPFALTNTQRSAHIDLYISPGTTVYGRVIGADRKPIDKADVICIPGYSKFFSPFDTPRAFRNVQSADDGTFTIPQVPVGEYQVMAQKKGFKFAATGEPIYPDGYSDIRNVTVMLNPVSAGQSTVFGTVMDASNRPIESVRLTLGAVGGEDMSAGQMDATTDAQGRYTFKGVQSGFLLLRAVKPGYEGQNVSNVKLDEATDITMQSAGSLRGVVLVRETGSPPQQQCTVQAMRIGGAAGAQPGFAGMMGGGGLASAQTGSDGSFEFELDAGTYALTAQAQGLTPGRMQVTLAAGQDLDGITIYVRQSGARIQGQVTLADGNSPQGALVWLGGDQTLPVMGAATQQSGVQVGADGVFEFSSLAGGQYTIQARLENYAQAQTGPVQLADGQTLSGINLTIRAGNALEGHVLFSGKPEAGAIVTVVGNNINEMTTSDSEGFYHIDRLPAGSYLASAVSFTGGAVAGLFSPLHARVDIVEGTTTTYDFGEPTRTALVGLCTPPPASGTIGYAILHLPGVDVAALNLMNPGSWFMAGNTVAGSIMGMSAIDRTGYFEIDNLVPGQYLLDVFFASLGEIMSGNFRRVYADQVTIAGDQRTEIQVPTAGP